MKKKKHQLSDLRINSFVTDHAIPDADKIKGGDTTVIRFSDLCEKSTIFNLCRGSHINCAIPQ